MTGFTLEPLTAADGDFRMEVFRATIKPYLDDLFGWDEATQTAIILDQLKGASHSAIVTGGQRVGIVQVEASEDAISLRQIEILPRFQGRGIGTAMVRSFMDRCGRKGKLLTLHVFKSNTAALRLYGRLGFRVSGQGEHDIEMTYTLTPR